ncbi:MAG: hypothetical protein J6Y02_14665 [Pseudobutyrivibrio sp.]|nr:hypothetical protein [Pseudobutyrivibrio sp.]
MKVFISQAMRGLDNDTILAKREEILNKVKELYPDKEIELIDSFFKDAPTEAKPLWYLGDSLKLMSEADLIVFADGWESARGCKIEHECAIQYGYTFQEL